jgi:cyclophilin family peptidyl-prolyl cis-trans isomerase
MHPRQSICRSILVITIVVVGSPSLGVAQQPPKINSARPDIRWDDGTDPHAGHNHPPGVGHKPGDGSGQITFGPAVLPDTPEEKKLKASLTPEQRAEYDRRKAAARGQEAVARNFKFGILPANDDSPLAKEYQAAFEAFREAMAESVTQLNRNSLAYNLTPQQIEEFNGGWFSSVAKCIEAKSRWIGKAGEIYATDPTKYAMIGQSLKEMLLFDVDTDRFEGWSEPAKALVQAEGPLVTPEVMLAAASACLANNDFDGAQSIAAKLKSTGFLSPQQEQFMDEIPKMKETWLRELDFRKKDAEKNNNPRVELITSKGRMVIELFEDEAPEAVNSFVYLVERSFYSRKPFFRVEQHVVAQTGCEKGDGTGDAGYTFRGEALNENHRDHFRGSCAIALGGSDKGIDQDSGSSQFYLSMIPLPHLDGNYTVFGRVIEGIEILGLLRQLNLANKEEKKENANPDFIIRAKVLRKRDHEYKPTPVRGKLFK